MWRKAKAALLGFLLGALGLLFLGVQYFRGVARDQARRRRLAEEERDAAKALRQQERDIQAARGVVQEEARDVEAKQMAARRDDVRPDYFGDERLHERAKGRRL